MKAQPKLPTQSRLDGLATVLVAGTLAVVPFHAFLTVWASSLVGHFTLLRLWDEAALLLLLAYVVWKCARDGRLRQALLGSRLTRTVAAYVLLTLLLGVVAFIKHQVSAKALGYAGIINLRFLLWMLGVWVVASQSEWLRRYWRQLVFVPLALTVLFGLLQFFVLPHDFLRHFGYHASGSYAASVTLNQDSSTIRVQSFLRGANPLGAYLAALFVVVLAFAWPVKKGWRYVMLAVAAAAALFLTFSRSAWLGAALSTLLAGWFWLRSKRLLYFGGLAAIVLVAILAAVSLRHVGGVQNALFHHADRSTATVTSNQGHESAFHSSLSALKQQPLGDGPGTAGQASVYNSGHSARNTESFWLQLGLEIGWPGIVLFMAVLAFVARELWLRRSEPLALALLASLAGLVLVNALSYGWTDDTVAFVWWGLVGIALAYPTTARSKA